MDPGKIFQIITNSTLLATRLLSGSGPLEFSEPRYCAVLSEDAQLAATVLAVTATHSQGTAVRYSITGGNKDGLFTIDQHSGVITLAAALDFEAHDKHELVVAAEGEGQAAHTMVQVTVLDVNDNAPYFLNPKPQVTVVEEDDRHLPATIATVEATDADWLDHHGLLYTVRGDGVDGFHPTDAFFSINSLTGELIQLKALDRDPPRGMKVWKVRVQVRDGQALWSRQAMDRLLASNSKKKNKGHSAKVNRRRRSESNKSNTRNSQNENVPAESFVTLEENGTVSNIERKRGYRRGKSDKRGLVREDAQEYPLAASASGINGLRNVGVKLSMDKTTEARDGYIPGDKYEAWVNSEHKPGTVRGNARNTRNTEDKLGIMEEEETEHQRMIRDDDDNFEQSESRHRKDNTKVITKIKERDSISGHKDTVSLSRPTRGLLKSPDKQTYDINSDLKIDSTKRVINGPSHVSRRGNNDSVAMGYPLFFNPYNKLSGPGPESAQSPSRLFPPSQKGVKTPDAAKFSDHEKDILSRYQTSTLQTSDPDPTVRANSNNEDRRFEYFTRNNVAILPDQPRSDKMKKSFSTVLDPQPSLVTSRGRRAAEEEHYQLGSFSADSGCDEGQDSASSNKTQPSGRRLGGGSLNGLGGSRVHVSETMVTVLVKDINDNPPVFPNATMYGEVQENGPIDLSVVVIAAWDADDVSEGTNARITYTIQKNVVYEPTGEAIFTVHPETGLVRTSICCLDRETTPEYEVQVVATDGGGLQGTGVVVVRLVDVNDNSPRLEQSLWDVEIDETWGPGPPDDSTLLQITALDADTSNYFFYRVVEASGWGWEHFGIRSVGAEGQLFSLQTLDYEDDTHRRGFKFMVQVTDRGRGGWRDPRHVDAAWVSIRLRDINDNPPKFHRPHAHVTVREDAAPGTLLAALPAHDPDMGGVGEVLYRVEGGWGALTVDSEGGVSLRHALDREAPDGAIGVAKIVGVDRGRPPLSATATLTITVTDVNDSPPVLLPPTVFHVTEGAAPTLLGSLTATDHDVWALGHGPPFNLSLAPTNPAHVLAHINIKFDPHLDSGRGGAEVWTVGAVDREEHRQLLVGVLVADAGGMAATHTVTIIVDDINDNPMKPAAKTVYLWKTQGGGSEAPLGRVYVEDPDDWDLADKTFSWQGSPHPVFSLNTQTGDIFASSQVRAGRYELQFTVSDHLWGQRDVAANVTVTVKVLTPDALAHAAPVTLTPTTPAHLTRGWTPEHGGGGLGRVIQGVLRVVGEAAHTVEVVSVYTHPDPTHLDDAHLDHNDAGHTHPYHTPGSASIFTNTPTRSQHWMTHAPSACVWVNVRESQGGFMDPIKLQGLLALRSHQVEAATNLTVVAEAPSSGGSGGGATNTQHYLTFPSLLHDGGPPDPSSAAYRASTTLPLQVVDINSTSLVTPRLTRAHVCYAHDLETCTPTSCLNGGRCVGSLTGNRCVCPGGSWGARCKVLGRTFSGAGWAWVRPLPSCLPTTISLKLLTRRPHALLLYSGPLAPAPPLPNLPTTPMLALQVWRGRPQLLLEGGAGAVKLEVNTTVNDGDWHTLHLYLHPHGVALMVDVCGHSRGWDNDTLDDSDCVARASWPNPEGVGAWIGSGPLQVGGLAHTAPSPAHHGWSEAPTPRPLDGCVSHLTVNSQLVDLGEPAYSLGSEGGCHLQEAACPGSCGHRGQCVGGLNHPDCECEPGWAGPSCASPTVPATLGSSSYVRLTLSFMPGPRVVTAQLRLRTRGARHGLLLHLATQQQLTALTIHLRAGVVCASVTGVARVACVEGRPVGDGAWHTIRAERHGHNLVVSVDDGDGWRRNESLVSLEQPDEEGDVRESPVPLDLGQNEGVTVGGLPELVGVNIVNVLDDLQESCIDDVRVSGRQLPLPPAVNGTSWGQVTTWQNVESGCNASDACLNTTCDAPLSCVSTWGATTCSCGSGRQLVGRSCQDLDECVWRPCLHGGTCYNLRPGFQCVCGPGHAGDHCQWNNLATAGHPLTAPVAIATVAVSLLLLVVVGVVLSVRLRRQWFTRGPRARQGEAGGQEGTVLEMKDGVESDAQVLQADHHQALLHCLRLPLPHHHTSSSSQDKEESVPVSHNTPYTGDAPVTTSVPVTTIVPVSVGVPMTASVRVGVTAGVVGLDPLPAKDDLRAYAYEGDGSSAGSLSSALSGLREEQFDTENIQSLAPEFLEVMDLLRNLPEATKSPSLLPKLKEQKARRRRSSVESTVSLVAATQCRSPHGTRNKISSIVKRKFGSSPVSTKTANAATASTASTASPKHVASTADEERTTV